MACVVAAVLLLLSSSAFSSEIHVGSFNIRMLSAASRNGVERGQIADRLQAFDLVAVQEVKDDSIVAILVDTLAARGESFSFVQADAQGAEPNDERCAFLYRPDRVQLVGGLQTVLDSDSAFVREPSWATFRAGAFDFTLITVHLVYGETVGPRRAEARVLDDVVRAVRASDPDEQDVLLVGDFNLDADDQGFDELRQVLGPLFPPGTGTTIAGSDYDNIWLDEVETREWTGEKDVDRFDDTVFNGDDDAASLAVSDHRPIWATFTTDGPDDDGTSVTAVRTSSWAAVKGSVR